MGIEIETTVVVGDGTLLDVKSKLADVHGVLWVPGHGEVTTDVYQLELVTAPAWSVSRLMRSITELVGATCDYLEVLPKQLEYRPYDMRPLDPAHVLHHPHQHLRVNAQLDALRMESGGRLTDDVCMMLARACSTHFHIGHIDAQGNTLAMSDPERREFALALLNVFGNAGPYMVDWCVRKLNIPDDMRRKALWHHLTRFIPRRTPKSGTMYFSWEGYVRCVCERGPRLVRLDERGLWVVDLETPATIDDAVVRKTTWGGARLSDKGTVEVRSLQTAEPEQLVVMAELVMMVATAIQQYLKDHRVDTMRAMEYLFQYLHRHTGGFVPRRPLSPREWLHLTLG